jgi:hypothetical protein
MVVDKVSAGVAPPELAPAKPFALATDTAVTLPVVGVVQVGTPPAALVKTCPTVPTAVYASAVPVPYTTVPEVGVAVLFVPPLAMPRVPLQPRVREVAASKAVVGAPPSVSVTLVSSVFDSAELVTPTTTAVVPDATIGALPVTLVMPLVPLEERFAVRSTNHFSHTGLKAAFPDTSSMMTGIAQVGGG